MSPLWRDEIGIYLAPRKIVLMRMGRGLKPRVLAETGMTFDEGDFGTWASTLGGLAKSLDGAMWQRANTRVVLSDHWARYAIVPWSNDLRTHAERLSQARIALADVYGDVVADWTVTLDDVAPGTAQVACAIPTALVAELWEIIESRGLSVVSLQPQLIVAFNRWRSRLPASGAWFVSIEEGSLAAARLANGGWDRVHAVRIGADWPIELKRLQTFGRLASARPEDGRVFIDAPPSLRYAAGAGERDLEWLDDDGSSDGTTDKLAFMQRFRA